MTEWKPIESIPKDGSSILIDTCDSIQLGWYDAQDEIFRYGCCRCVIDMDYSTHWMPLPDKPIRKGSKL